MQELKPCPFCGAYKQSDVHVIRKGSKYHVSCSACGASGGWRYIQPWHDNKFVAQGQAITAWNRRDERSNSD